MLKGLSKYGKAIANTLSGKDVLQVFGAPTVLFRFTSEKDVDRWHAFSDQAFGGQSTVSLQLSPTRDAMVFSGHCTTRQDADADLVRSGYCSASSKVLAYGEFLDLERHSHLVMAVRGDGATYLCNMRVDTMSGNGGDVWQAPFTPPANVWSEVRIPLHVFAMTNRGQLVRQRSAIDRAKVVAMGVAFSVAEARTRALEEAVAERGGGAEASAQAPADAPSPRDPPGGGGGEAGAGARAEEEGSTGVGDAMGAGGAVAAADRGAPQVERVERGRDFRLEIKEIWGDGLAEA